MLAGFWLYFLTLWRGLGLRALRQEFWKASPKAFWLISSLALLVGTFQGLLQVIPATARILDLPSEIPNIHAQLNMIGGVLLALMGLVYIMLPKLIGQEIDSKYRRYNLYGVSFGIFGYYMVMMVAGLLRYGYLRQGLSDGQAAIHLGWVIPAFLVLTSLPMFLGNLAFGAGLWKATVDYRYDWSQSIAHLPDRYNNPRRQFRYPLPFYLLVEAISAMAGFPGLGWLLSGRALPGVPMMMAGPIIAWAALPMLMDPYGTGPLKTVGFISIFFYLCITTLLSLITLGLTLIRTRKHVEGIV
jgi:hypothetical protein